MSKYLKLKDDFESAISTAINKKAPTAGWPKAEPTPQRAPKNPKRGPRTKKPDTK